MGNFGDSEKPDAVSRNQGRDETGSPESCAYGRAISGSSRRASVPHSSDGHGAMCLGLRISEIRALQWQDFDLKGRILTLTRSIVGRYVWNGGKTGASEDEVFLDSKLVSVLEDWRKQCVETPEAWLFANADTKRPVHGDAIQKDYLRPAGEKIGLQGVGWHSFRHTYRTLIDDIGTPLGVQQRLMRHADIKTTMNTYGSAFEKTKRRANSRVADLVLPPAIKSQLKDRAKEVSLKNLRPETATIQ